MEKKFKEPPSHRHCRMRTVLSISVTLAGVYVPADIYVRYLRLKKKMYYSSEVRTSTGVPITIRAKKEGITPQDVVDRYHSLIKNHSKNSVSHSTCIAAPLRRRITNWLRISSKHCTIKANSSRKRLNNITTRKQNIPCRPLYHRRMSPLPFRRRLRRPMRKMRNLTFSYGSYQPEKCYQRQQTGNERNQTLVSSSRQARRMAAQMDSGRSQRMASQRIRLPMQKLARHGTATTCREP